MVQLAPPHLDLPQGVLWLNDQSWEGSAGLPAKAKGRDSSLGGDHRPPLQGLSAPPLFQLQLTSGRSRGLFSVGLAFPLGQGGWELLKERVR